jgi:hypothetical protein
MPYPPILLVHICAGSVGLLSGTAAIFFRKASARHVLAGKIFVASMLTMAVGAVYLAITRRQHLSPALFNTSLYLIITILPLILLIFWLIRFRFKNAYKGQPMPPGGEGHSLATAD